MSTAQLRPSARTRPFVAVVCAVPLLGEAMRLALEFAEVQTFAANGGDLDGLLRWLRPDAVIVDTASGAEQATVFAAKHDLPVLHVSVQERGLRLLYGGVWADVGDGTGPELETLRNVLAGALFGRGGAA